MIETHKCVIRRIAQKRKCYEKGNLIFEGLIEKIEWSNVVTGFTRFFYEKN